MRSLSRLPDGYYSSVGPGGEQLSHGQRQLVCLVRAYLIDPAILILDEATSAIDLYTERRIQRALQRLTSGRTAIVIAHRLATIRDADRILVLKDGRLVEDGEHDQLIGAGGVYQNLYQQYERGELQLHIRNALKSPLVRATCCTSVPSNLLV